MSSLRSLSSLRLLRSLRLEITELIENIDIIRIIEIIATFTCAERKAVKDEINAQKKVWDKHLRPPPAPALAGTSFCELGQGCLLSDTAAKRLAGEERKLLMLRVRAQDKFPSQA